MAKRILLVLGAIVAITAGAIWFAATESYVLTLNAEVATAMDVSPHGSIDWGVVFSQKTRSTSIDVSLSNAAAGEIDKTCDTGDVDAAGDPIFEPCPNITGVQYSIGCVVTTTAKLDICQYVTVDGSGSTQKLTSSTRTANHVIKFVAPPCVAQKGSTEKQAAADASNCDQDTSLVLTGDISVSRVGFQNLVVKCDVVDKKGDVTTCPAGN